MAIGYNKKKALKFTTSIMTHYLKLKPEFDQNITTSKTDFKNVLIALKKEIPLEGIKKIESYFFAIAKLLTDSEGLIILLGGASGTGKSSLTSIMAARMNLQLFSSDNIRHSLRGFKLKSESPFIFASTYTADNLIQEEGLSQEEKILKGYHHQCKAVQEQLFGVLEQFYKSGKWVIVEGVHLTADFIIKCMKEFKNCFGAMIQINKEESHKSRFISRSATHSLNPESNPYVKNLHKIRLIQGDLLKGAAEKKLPIINNKILDKSVTLVHKCFLGTFEILKKQPNLLTGETAEGFREHYRKVLEKYKSLYKVNCEPCRL